MYVCAIQDDDTDEFLAGAATRHDELGRDFMQLQARRESSAFYAVCIER